MRRHFTAVLIASTLSAPSFAQDSKSKPAGNGKGPVHSTAPSDDSNYPLMGEFSGEISLGDETKETIGLQIRPVGGDNFDALSFKGGLPGQEDVDGEPMRLIGRRSGDTVILSGGPWAMFVSAQGCTLIDREGKNLGTLARVTRTSPTMGAPAAEGAVVLFDGSNVDQFTNATMTDDGLLMAVHDLKPMFQDFNLHVEFQLPYMPEATDQSRANSGLYLQSRYECQVLDSFAQEPVFNGLGALYRFKKPDVNMCFPPLVWQTYDVEFTAPRWASDGKKIRDAHVTSWVNGVIVQENVALSTQTGAGKKEEPNLLPIKLQDHGDPVRYRNVWLIDRGLTSVKFPVEPTAEQLEAAEKAKADKAEMKAAEEKAKADKAEKEAEAKD